MAIDFQRAPCFQGGTGVSNTWICSLESSPGTGAGGALIGSSFWLLHGIDVPDNPDDTPDR